MPELFVDPPPNLLTADDEATDDRKAPMPAVRPSSLEDLWGVVGVRLVAEVLAVAEKVEKESGCGTRG